MRNISASLTEQQILESGERVKRGEPPVKDVTRRRGWEYLKVGERLQVCRKCMGRKPGEPLVKLAIIEVVSVRREPLRRMIDEPDYGYIEVRREGFERRAPVTNINLTMSPLQFIGFFCATHKGCTPESLITRIEFKYIV